MIEDVLDRFRVTLLWVAPARPRASRPAGLYPDAVGSRDQLNGGITTIGTILMLVSATAFTRALQHVYEQAWGLPRVRGGARGLAWLVGLIVYIVIIAASARLAGLGPPGTVLRTVIVVGGAAFRGGHHLICCWAGSGALAVARWSTDGRGDACPRRDFLHRGAANHP